MKLVDLPRYGPVHRFADYHVFKTLSILSDGRRKGRKQLAEMVDVGEGSMRTIIEYLREREMIDVKQTGVKIAAKGHEFLSKLPIYMERVEPTDSTLGERSAAVLVKGQSMKIKMGVEQRDSAIKAGAEGATTIIVSGGQLVVPPDYDLDKERPEFAETLRRLLAVSEGDVIIIGTAKTYNRAEDGALAAAFELI
jgi:predicted transcriptional regulator